MPQHPLADPHRPDRYCHPYDPAEDPYARDQPGKSASPAMLGLTLAAAAVLGWAGARITARR